MKERSSGIQCPAVDDNGIKCQNVMTKREYLQDGYCYRCADLIYSWWIRDTPIIYKFPNTREV